MIASGRMAKNCPGLWLTCTHCYVKMDNQRGPTVQHGTLLNVVRQSEWRGAWGRMDTDMLLLNYHCFYKLSSIYLSISYAPIQN